MRYYLNGVHIDNVHIDNVHIEACDCTGKHNRTDGLRVIKRFERVNECVFDPFDRYHVGVISGHADKEHFFRATRAMFKTEET